MFSSKLIANTLYKMAMDEEMTAQKVADAFLFFAKHYKLTAQLGRVIYFLEKRNERRMRFNSLQITSPFNLSEEQKNAVAKYVGAPKDVAIFEKADASLIGGFVAKYGGLSYDASVKARLFKLKEVLINNSKYASRYADTKFEVKNN